MAKDEIHTWSRSDEEEIDADLAPEIVARQERITEAHGVQEQPTDASAKDQKTGK